MLLYGLQQYWKPLLVLIVAAGLWGGGYHKARQNCRADNLRAENAELSRQLTATKTILEKTAAAGAARQAEINRLNKEVQTYESGISESKRFILFDADVSGLRRIK